MTTSFSSSGDHQQALTEFRREIDTVDSEIVRAIATRMGKVSQVAKQKIQHGPVFRARREIEKIHMMEKLAAQHKISENLIFDIWRLIMSASAYRQNPYEIHCIADDALYTIARGHFGLDIPIYTALSIEEIQVQHQTAPDRVMCLFHKDNTDWWQAVLTQDNLNILAELPWRNHAPAQAYLVANCPVDLESEADVFCVLTPDDPSRTLPEKTELTHLFDAPIVSLHRAADQAQWLVRLHDVYAHDSLVSLRARFTLTLKEGWSSEWLGRLPVFHQ